ncbi:hypothetical protein [Corynebacterium cystitidis]|uniref:hypothetical protein n=1 Tax=Corynebacterium cystitidis TaxID=35757 RepID=UPI00211EF797|nr:hypothetical protein [Corynebacterium cystitidis]
MAGMHADLDAIRAALQQAHDEVSTLRRIAEKDSPFFPVSAAGAGFTERGKRLAAALEEVQQGTIRRLEARLRHFDQIAAATDAIEGTEEENVGELSRNDIG